MVRSNPDTESGVDGPAPLTLLLSSFYLVLYSIVYSIKESSQQTITSSYSMFPKLLHNTADTKTRRTRNTISQRKKKTTKNWHILHVFRDCNEKRHHLLTLNELTKTKVPIINHLIIVP